mgnify:CR=1 FL=1
MARPNKGQRDQMMVYPPEALACILRSYADAIDVPHGEYIASVLAERLGHPYWAAAEVRLHPGGLTAMLDAAEVSAPEVDAAAWRARAVFVTKPVKALGDVIRAAAAKDSMSLTGFITSHLAAFHGVDLDAHTIEPRRGTEMLNTEHIVIREEVQQLLA